MKKIISIFSILFINTLLFASAGISGALELQAQEPKYFDSLGFIVGLIFVLFIGVMISIDYIKNKFKS